MDLFYRCVIDLSLICLFVVFFVLFVSFGFKAIDKILNKIDIETEIANKNMAAGIFASSIIISMTYGVVEVIKVLVG
jgi:hypothetical protein